jgi:peptide/nickel transport system permease protein
MSQVQPAIELTPVVPPQAGSRRLRAPGWVSLLLKNPKSRVGLVMVAGMIVVALIAPLVSVDDPMAFSIFDARQAPSWHHLFGTTDQGSDIFSQVMLGARRSLFLGAASATLATVLAATLGILAAYSGGVVDELINFLTNVFLVIPTIPLLIVISSYLQSRNMWTMILVLGLTLWAF